MHGRIQHGHAQIHVTNTCLSIIVQHIQSPHARDEIKLIKYATHFRDGHAPTPNYTNHHSLVVPEHAERPEQDLRMTITGGQQLEEEWFAGRWVGRWASAEVARAHARPTGR